MVDVPQHDETDELEAAVAQDETASLAERLAMLDALRRMRARAGDPAGRAPPSGGPGFRTRRTSRGANFADEGRSPH